VSNISVLSDKSLMIIFTYAHTGHGHLRVTDALSNGLPEDVTPVLLGSFDKKIDAIHRFISIHYVTNQIMEWFQRGRPQDFFTFWYRRFLRSHTDVIYEQMKEVFQQRVDVPKKAVVVATHFGLAHQLAVVKKRLENEEGISITLVVQVTDDSPQHIWYVPGADIIFVPSIQTKKELQEYGIKARLEPVQIEALPYPISPLLGQNLNKSDYEFRLTQLSKFSGNEINIAVPISGAAIGMDFFRTLINLLHERSPDFQFHVVAQTVPFTLLFLNQIKHYPYVSLYTSRHARETVDLYDLLYRKEVISLEITKPSEQAFKALFRTDQRGGSVLLFSRPVGRQEYDNLNFLRRHGLIFSQADRDMLWKKSAANQSIGDYGIVKLFEGKGKMRGIEIPYDPVEASKFIWWCLSYGILEKIGQHGSLEPENSGLETRSDGVSLFWTRVASLL
jgi:hypothetical protein